MDLINIWCRCITIYWRFAYSGAAQVERFTQFPFQVPSLLSSYSLLFLPSRLSPLPHFLSFSPPSLAVSCPRWQRRAVPLSELCAAGAVNIPLLCVCVVSPLQILRILPRMRMVRCVTAPLRWLSSLSCICESGRGKAARRRLDLLWAISVPFEYISIYVFRDVCH